MTTTIKVTSKQQLIDIIKASPDDADLNHLDVSDITDMSLLFYESPFNGDISQWDVSHVTNMEGMFENSRYNGELNDWNISNLTDINDILFNFRFTHNKFNRLKSEIINVYF